MLCDKIQDNLSAYIDGEAGPQLAAEIERHVSECEQCRATLGQLRKVAGLVGSMPQHTAPVTLAEDVQGRLERQMLMEAGGEPEPAAAQADRRLPQRRPAMWPRVAAVAACLVLVAGIAALLAPLGGRKTEYAAGPAAPVDRIAAGKVDGLTVTDWDSATTTIARADEDKLGAVREADSTDGQVQRSLRSRDPEFYSKIASDAAGNVGQEAISGVGRAGRHVSEKARAEGLFTGVEAAKKNNDTERHFDTSWLAYGGRRASGAGDNELFLVAADVESGERAVQDALVQAGVVNATLNRAVLTPARSSTFAFRLSQDPERPTTAKGAAAAAGEDAEVLEIVTIEARVAPSQAATLNLLVANSDALTVSEASNGVFAQAAQTQQLMQQVPAVERNRALADNRIVQDNLKMQTQRVNLSQEMPRQVAGFQWKGEGRDEDAAAKALRTAQDGTGAGGAKEAAEAHDGKDKYGYGVEAVTQARKDDASPAPAAADVRPASEEPSEVGLSKVAEAADEETMNKPAEENAPAGAASGPASAMRRVMDLPDEGRTAATQPQPASPAAEEQAAPAEGDRRKDLDRSRQQEQAPRPADTALATNNDVTPGSAAPVASPAPAAAQEPGAAPQVQTNAGARTYRETFKPETGREAAASATAATATAGGATQAQAPEDAGVHLGVREEGSIRGVAAAQLEGGAVTDDSADEASLPIVIQLVVRRGPSQAAAAAPDGQVYDSVRDASQKAATEAEQPQAPHAEVQAAPSPLPPESDPREAPAQP
ncbi:MAG: hypothetical protein GXY74_08975 [Phycisphaerae bacterium]|nr:hypothetical protein [Phycisphaerae bacterium]